MKLWRANETPKIHSIATRKETIDYAFLCGGYPLGRESQQKPEFARFLTGRRQKSQQIEKVKPGLYLVHAQPTICTKKSKV